MKLAASNAIAALVTDEDIANGIIIPSAFNKSVVNDIAAAVARAAVESGVARIELPEKYKK
jgi:malate dehydrogenase (oxaloacetate-decarboxylating)